jgi:CRP-like cAMP-binding protein
VLSEPGDRLTHVFFPTAGIVSLFTTLENGASGSVALVGNEGLVGMSVFLEGTGARGPPPRAVVHSTGHAYRLRADFLLREFESGTELQRVMLRATQALIMQIGQTAVCNRHHTIAQQLGRWLLLSLDRLPGNELRLTHEQLANVLGVRREGVTEAALQLQSAGLIDYGRGRVVVLNRLGLEQQVCECYAAIKHEYARLLTKSAPDSTPWR